MYGQIHCVIRELVQKKFGNETWETVLKTSGLDEHQAFLMFTRYDDASTFKLVGAVSETLEISVETVLEVFGEFFFDYCIRHGYDKMLQTLGHDIKSFIQNLDSLHALLALSYKGISAPSFRCEDGPDGSLILHYYSSRPGLYPIVKGVLKAVARDLFDQSVEMSIMEQNKEDIGCDKYQEHTAFLVQLRCNSTRSIKSRASTACDHEKSLVSFNPETVLLKASDFCSAFPYHVIFDRNLKIKQCGVLIQKHSCHVIQEGTPLGLAFDIMHPKMVISIENIRKFINAVFLLAICSEEVEKKRMVVKGQMIWIEDTQHMIFIGSPRLTSLNELVEMNVYLADIPLYDVTRELVLLNQQRIAEIDIAKRLDETTAQLKKTGQELEGEKRKTELLLHQMLPRKVATALTQGRTVEAEKFEEVTILFSDIVTFTNIASACSPMDIVDMLNEMYRRFDERTSQHNVYKVETIGDAYMIVSGVPEKTSFHAPPVANFAMDMLADAGEVMSPATGKPLQIRVGVHTGPVVAGVVGVKMPRYCLFGDTVNTASRMESHGAPARIHLSGTTRNALQGWGYAFTVRGEMEVKGKGKMRTYFLAGTADRSVPEPDDDFTGLETFLDSSENRVCIKITSESTEDLDQKGKDGKSSNTTTELENGEDENYFLKHNNTREEDDVLHSGDLLPQRCPFTGLSKDSDVNNSHSNVVEAVTANSSEIQQNGRCTTTTAAAVSAEIHDKSKNPDCVSSDDVPSSSPSKTNGGDGGGGDGDTNNPVVENVFFNVCCGFPSSVFSNKTYNSVSAVDNNENSPSSSVNDEQSGGVQNRMRQYSTHDPKNPQETIPTSTTHHHHLKSLHPNRPLNESSTSTNTSTKKQPSTDGKHKSIRSHGNIVSPLKNNILVPEKNFTNDSLSLSSVQSFIGPSLEPHPNHVYRCKSTKPFIHGGGNSSSSNSHKTGPAILATGSANDPIVTQLENNTSTKHPALSSMEQLGRDGAISCSVPRGEICPSKLSVECDSSVTNLQTSWSHDHLLKVRKTRKKSVKKDRSKMCSLS